jgi:hypothetical protein
VFIVFPAKTPEGKLFCGGATGVGAALGFLVTGGLVLGFFVPAGGDFEAVGVGVTGRESVATDASCGGL